MKHVLGSAACAALVLFSPLLMSGSLAQDSGTSYCAFLSETDHYNSKGVRLTTAGQVLRQDRANFHRFGLRDDWDDNDTLFMSAENRALLEQKATKELISEDLWTYIVNNEVYVCVDAYETLDGDADIAVWIAE